MRASSAATHARYCCSRLCRSMASAVTIARNARQNMVNTSLPLPSGLTPRSLRGAELATQLSVRARQLARVLPRAGERRLGPFDAPTGAAKLRLHPRHRALCDREPGLTHLHAIAVITVQERSRGRARPDQRDGK